MHVIIVWKEFNEIFSFTYIYSRGCRMNKAPFELLSLEKIIPIDNYLNYSQVK